MVAFRVPLLGTWSLIQACALTGNRTGNISAHRLAPNSLSHTSQGSFHLLQTSLPVSTAVHSHLFNDNLPLLYSNLWKAAIFQKYFIIFILIYLFNPKSIAKGLTHRKFSTHVCIEWVRPRKKMEPGDMLWGRWSTVVWGGILSWGDTLPNTGWVPGKKHQIYTTNTIL